MNTPQPSVLAQRLVQRLKSDLWLSMTLLVTIVGVTTNYLKIRGFVFDDAYITYRFAQNFAAGDGLVFNVGERVMGTTSPLSALVLGFLGALGFDIAKTGEVIFVFSLGAVALLGFVALRQVRAPLLGLIFAGWLLLGLGQLVSFWGLETPLYLALLLGSVQAIRCDRELTGGVLAGLAILARYDGGVGALVLAALIAVRTRRFPLRYAIGGCAVVLPWLAFAQLYYGSFLPQTLTAKADTATPINYLTSTLSRQIQMTSPFRYWHPWNLGHPFFANVFTFLLAGGVFAGVRRALKFDIYTIYSGLTALILWCSYAQIGPPIEQRWHTAPPAILAVLFCFICWGAAVAGPSTAKSAVNSNANSGSWRLLAGAAAALWFVFTIPGATQSFADHEKQNEVYRNRAGAYHEMAKFIRRAQLNDLTVMTAEPGYLSYLSQSPVIDLAGLVTQGGTYMHGPAEQRTSLENALKELQPDLVVLHPGSAPATDPHGYVNVYNAFSSRVLAMRPDVFRSRFEAIAAQLRSSTLATDVPNSTVWNGADWSIQADHTDDVRLTVQSAGGLLPRASAIVIGGERRPAFQTSRDRSVWSGMETPPFLIDFDRLVFSFEGTHDRLTAVQLVVDGQVVLQEAGMKTWMEGRIPALRELTWPLSAWRGRVGRLRFVDVAPGGHRVVFSSIEPQNDGSKVWEDFENGWPRDWTWSTDADTSDSPEPLPEPITLGAWETVARYRGLELMLSSGALSTISSGGTHRIESPVFAIPNNISFLVFDHCDAGCSVELRVNGRIVRSHTLTGTNQLTPVVWGFRRTGRPGTLHVIDTNQDPNQGLVLDQITHAVHVFG